MTDRCLSFIENNGLRPTLNFRVNVATCTMETFTFMQNWLFLLCNVMIDNYEKKNTHYKPLLIADTRINDSNIYVNMTVTKLTKECIVLSIIHVPHVHCTLGDSYISKAALFSFA